MKATLSALGLGALLLTSACTAPSQGNLNAATAACSAGDRMACRQLPTLNAQVQQENSNNMVATGAAAAVGGAVLGGVVGAAAADNCGYYGCGRGYYYGRPYRRYGW